MQSNYTHISELLNKISQHNDEALWELFDYYKPAVMSCIRKISKNYPTIDQDDLYSESVLIFRDLCAKFDPEQSNFSYYLNTRLYPYLISKIKSSYLDKTNNVQLNEADIYIEQKNSFDLIDIHYDIEIAMSQLKPKQRLILADFYFNNLSQHEIAKKYQMSQPAVSSNIQKSMKILKKILE